ncbi:MAG: hypothetical protein JWO78_1720 [Micavibrio sp.]|nr:hypothetical protein [Micavibrio sp.]
MSDDRLPTSLYLDAHFKNLRDAGVFYYVHNKGAPASGTIMVKLNNRQDGCVILQQQRDIGGNLGWMKMLGGNVVKEAEADAFIKRAVERDPDVWVVEIEDPALKNPFEGKIF